jgi:hypothetical protein
VRAGRTSALRGGIVDFSAAANSEMTAADWWFAGLDQQQITLDNTRCTLQVLGVHVDGFHTWIQIEFAEDPDSSVLLHLTPWAGLQDALNIVLNAITDTATGAAADALRCLDQCCNLLLPGNQSAFRMQNTKCEMQNANAE